MFGQTSFFPRKRAALAGVLGAAMLLGGAFAVRAEPRIAQVDVFPQGAMISVQVEAGSFDVVLPGTIQSATIRLDGDMAMTPLEITSLPGEERYPPALGELAAKVEKLRSEMSELAAEVAALKQTVALLEKMTLKEEKAVEVVNQAAPVRRDAEKRLAQLSWDLAEKTRRYEQWKQELDARIPPGWERVVRVRGEVTKGAFLRAWTDMAWWRYEYRLDLDVAKEAITGRMRAIVSQNTGLPWSGTLRLHTARPPQSVLPPDLRPLVVRATDRRTEQNEAVQFYGAPAPAAFSAKSVMRDESLVAVQESESGVTVEAVGDVPGDGYEATLDLGAFRHEARVAIVLVPEFREEAWLLAEVASLDQPLLSGACELSIGGIPSGSTRIAEMARGEKLTLAFGISPQVRAKKEKRISTEGKSWTGTGRLEDGYVIDVVNGLPRKAKIRVVDRIPASAAENVTVEVARVQPKAVEDKEGVLSWEMELESGAKGSIDVLWKITWPGEKELQYQQKP